jgi:hypothetical protein
VNAADAALDAALAGLGITRVLSYQAARAIADGHLKVILETWDTGEIPVGILHREGLLTRPKVQAFVAFAANALRRGFAGLDGQGHKAAAAIAGLCSALRPTSARHRSAGMCISGALARETGGG